MIGDLALDSLVCPKVGQRPSRPEMLPTMRTVLNYNSKFLTDQDDPIKNKAIHSVPAKEIGVRYNTKPTKEGKFYLSSEYDDRRVTRFSSIQDLEEQGKDRPFLLWLLRWSNLNEQFLQVVEENPFTIFTINIKWAEYSEYLKEQVKAETGEYPDYGMFIQPSLAKQYRDIMKGEFVHDDTGND